MFSKYVTYKGNEYLYQKHTDHKQLYKALNTIMSYADKNIHAVVFDIDETILYNNSKTTVCDGAVPNPIMMKLYKDCIKKEIPVFFVTARRYSAENYRWTTRQLICVGASKYVKLYMRPKEMSSIAKVSEFKRNARAQIVRETGRRILINAGDQWHDVIPISNNREIDSLIGFDNTSYWLFQTMNEQVSWALKLPDVVQDPSMYVGRSIK